MKPRGQPKKRPEPVPVALSPEEIALVRSLVIYEDPHIMALNKPSGLSSQGGRGQVNTLDELLWAFDDDAYVPHQVAGDQEDELTPVLIATPDVDAPSRVLVINLRDDAYLGACDRVLEVVPADASAREPLRERWKQYKALGFDVNKYDM